MRNNTKKNGRIQWILLSAVVLLCLSMSACSYGDGESVQSLSPPPESSTVLNESSASGSSEGTENLRPGENSTQTASDSKDGFDASSGETAGGTSESGQDLPKSPASPSKPTGGGKPSSPASKQPADTYTPGSNSSEPSTEPSPESTPQPTPTPEPTPEPTPDPTPEPPKPSVTAMGSGYKADVLAGVNSHRNNALSMDGDLSSIAQAHAEEMARQKSAYHSCSGTESVGSGAWNDGFKEGSMLTVHCSDLASDDIVRIGVGAAKDENGSIYVCIVGKTY